MSSQVLPKKRGIQNGNGRTPSGRVSSLHDLSHKGRVISGRTLSKSKRVPSNNRHVSRGDLFVGRGEDANGSFSEENAIHFDENKNTILSNFEEWIKLSTDNKITSKNSWQFALIDYFHDLNVIKDGENINFQRASATLDGCVKIYLSRVESAATETGRLLSGLATKKGQEANENGEGNDDQLSESEEANDSQMGVGDSKRKRKINRVLESTLVPFETIRIRKLDQELAIDPLFKKALAEFDEGGAKSLLLNTLNIDSSGRVVFDATSNPIKDESAESSPKPKEKIQTNEIEPDISTLQNFIFKDPEELDDLTICPSLDQLDVVLADVNKAKTILSDVNNKFLHDEQNEDEFADRNRVSDEVDLEFPNYDDDDFGDVNEGNFDDENNEQQNKEFNETVSEQIVSNTGNVMTSAASAKLLDVDLMAYFDERMKTNWRGPEHWRVAAIKKSKRVEDPTIKKETNVSEPSQAQKKKQSIIINFFDDDDDDDIEDKLFETPKNSLSTTRKPDGRTNENANRLPEDIQYNSVRLTNLFMKPQTSILYFPKKDILSTPNHSKPLTDENFFANQYHQNQENDRMSTSMRQAELEDLDDFGNDDDFGGIDFNDALEGGTILSGSDPDKTGGMAGGTQLITGGRKVRPEYVNFSRMAKRVDVKLLKDNLWNSLKPKNGPKTTDDLKLKEESSSPTEDAKTFGDVVTSVGKLYGADEKKDLSTSFCFICLLHLANEHGFDIAPNEAHDDLAITGI